MAPTRSQPLEMNQQPSQEQVAAWYDEYKEHQVKIGVNKRHKEIFFQLKRLGLKPQSSILEVGCGIGTLTSLLAKYINTTITAVDLSPESIQVGKQLLMQYNHIEWVVSDMRDFKKGKTFDFIILPDVLEHIPEELHADLFKTLFVHSHDSTKVFIHIPHPKFTAWNKVHRPEGQQVIDQALDSSILLQHVYTAGFCVDELVSYSLWEMPFDYQRIVLSVNKPFVSVKKKSRIILWIEKLARLLDLNSYITLKGR